MTAGNETTRNATTGGLLALHPAPRPAAQAPGSEPGLLQARPSRRSLRWTSPIIHFCTHGRSRTSTSTACAIREGDHARRSSIPSANRDEDVFEDPYAFRDRPQARTATSAFGVGEHFCAGAHVARLELEMAFKYLLPRIEEIELAGPVDRLHSNLVGGIKRLPIRYKLKPA